MSNINKVENWTNLVTLCQIEQWTKILTKVWDRTKEYSPRYYEVRCSFSHQKQRYIGLDFRFFSQKEIKKELTDVMNEIGISAEYYDINPKSRSDEKAKLFSKCSGSYKGVQIDVKRTSGFLQFLSKVSNLAVAFLSDIEEMTSSHPESQEPRNEVSHLFRIMMGIQDGLDWDTVTDSAIAYPPLGNMLNHLAKRGID
ncbi:MAG: hypothetical protein ACFFER_16650 [Candidatus Thorarchaeota archaeon]